MKKIISTIVFLFFNMVVMSQTIYSMTNYDTDVLKNGNYIKDTDGLMDKFVGAWKYINGNDEFTINIMKNEHDNAFGLNDYYKDVLYGGYKYVKNGIIVIDRIYFTLNSLTDVNYPVMLGSGNFSNNYQTISLLGHDILKNKPLYIYLTVDILSPNTMEWKIEPREKININNSFPPSGAGFSIPTTAVLTKQ